MTTGIECSLNDHPETETTAFSCLKCDTGILLLARYRERRRHYWMGETKRCNSEKIDEVN